MQSVWAGEDSTHRAAAAADSAARKGGGAIIIPRDTVPELQADSADADTT
jgi:tRNA A37 threonylcarbamoyladenosine synthetase subunit TsaC/SUA5/YrdC